MNNSYFENANKSKKTIKVILISLSMVVIILIGFIILAINLGKNSDYDYFMSVTGTTAEQKNQIVSILEQCGVVDIKTIKNDDFLNYNNMIGFYIKTNRYNNVILFLNENDRSLNSIKYMGNFLYKDNSLLMTAEQSSEQPYKEFNSK